MPERYIDQLPLAHPQPGTWPTTQACALIGNLTGNLSVPRPALNPLSHTSQGPYSFLKEINTIRLKVEKSCVDIKIKSMFGPVLLYWVHS